MHECFRVRRYRMDELTIAQQAFVSAGVKAGLPFADDLDDLDAAAGIGPMPVNIVDGVRWNAAFAFLDPVRAQRPPGIAGNSTVRRLLLRAWPRRRCRGRRRRRDASSASAPSA